MLPRLSIIVPYRDRAEHLKKFLPHIVTYFQRDKADKNIPVNITIVEQTPGKPFNRGAIKNVGVMLNPDSDYYCFHDVDYLPIWADYSFPDAPMRIIWHGANVRPLAPGSRESITHNYELFFGGVILLTREHVMRTNGYPNVYWGWGWEDGELRARCLAEGLPIKLRDGTFEPLLHINEGYTSGIKPTEVNDRNREIYTARRNQIAAGTMYKTEGVNSVRFEILDRQRPRDQYDREALNVEKVTVELHE